MFTLATGRVPQLSTAAGLRRIAAVLAVVAGGVLAWAAIPAGATTTIPVPGPGGAYGPVPVTLPAPAQVITVGGMPGWQITFIAIAAALDR